MLGMRYERGSRAVDMGQESVDWERVEVPWFPRGAEGRSERSFHITNGAPQLCQRMRGRHILGRPPQRRLQMPIGQRSISTVFNATASPSGSPGGEGQVSGYTPSHPALVEVVWGTEGRTAQLCSKRFAKKGSVLCALAPTQKTREQTYLTVQVPLNNPPPPHPLSAPYQDVHVWSAL